MNNSIQPYRRRKTFTVGDGSTAFSTERPRTGDEKYRPSIEEALQNFSHRVNDLAFAVIDYAEVIHNWVESPELQSFITCLKAVENEKQQARQRSRNDVRQKRRAMMGRRGRR